MTTQTPGAFVTPVAGASGHTPRPGNRGLKGDVAPAPVGEAGGGATRLTYDEFLRAKARRAPTVGRDCDAGDVSTELFPFQRDIVAWAVRKGRAAIWSDTGTGKTRMQVEWARLSGRRALILAPLAVTQQTIREAAHVGVTVGYARNDAEAAGPGVWITNYERVEAFDPTALEAVVLDEGSILKQSTGATRNTLVRHFADVPARLSCTATPAPNDIEELTNQAEFLGVMPRAEMLAAYFVHDTDGWRVKGHARRPMFRWMASWAVALRRPSDLGYPDDGYDLPALRVIPEIVENPVEPDGELFVSLGGVGGRAKVRRDTLESRCRRAAELVIAEHSEPWVLWCGLNDEADTLARLIPHAVNVHGSMSPEDKASAFLGFADGSIRHIITKGSIAALGMNWQHCARMAFVGLNDSYEGFYQAVRRCYRYGQRREVHAHLVLSDTERAIADNIARKGREAQAAMADLVAEMTLARSAA